MVCLLERTKKICTYIRIHSSENAKRFYTYLMGVGTPEDLVYAVSKDRHVCCVMPTRNARMVCFY